MFLLIVPLLVLTLINTVFSSIGDQSFHYKNCLENCIFSNCTKDGLTFANAAHKQPVYEFYMQWTCRDDCKYDCMWQTVQIFHKRKWRTPQFHGKWPFVRLFGMQEPASAIFSILNLFANIKMNIKFTKEVRPDSPLYKLWNVYSYVCMHSWVWSTIFHSKDTLFTEYMDYVCAFLIVLMFCYCMTIRMLRKLPRAYLIIITILFVAFFLNHVVYLSGKFDYTYNMLVNITIGTFTAAIWLLWCLWNKKRQPYVYKCALFVTLSGVVILLEIIDIPPILWTFDCHAIWHLVTAPLVCIFYSFIIDDCKYLRKMEVEELLLRKLDKKIY